MDINTRSGNRVVFLGRNGYPDEASHAVSKGLVPEQIYTVDYVQSYSSISYVHLRGFDVGFNTVMFANVSSRPDWDEYFLNIAKVVSTRSHDEETQVGAVIVKERRIVSTGYNGFPSGQADWELPNRGPEKYPYMIHAELNAIASSSQDLKGSTLYCTLTPCLECTKAIITAGIVRIVAGRKYSKCDNHLINRMLSSSGISLKVNNE